MPVKAPKPIGERVQSAAIAKNGDSCTRSRKLFSLIGTTGHQAGDEAQGDAASCG